MSVRLNDLLNDDRLAPPKCAGRLFDLLEKAMMRKRRADERWVSAGWLATPVLFAVTVTVAMVVSRSRDHSVSTDHVLVVSGGSATPAPRRLLFPAPARATIASASPPGVATAHLVAAYPFLRDASLRCAGERCRLDVAIYPMEAQGDLDKRQEMLLGGLAATLARDGYAMAAPFDMTEVDSNVFHISATLDPGQGHDGGGSVIPATSSRAAARSALNAGEA